MQTQTVTIPLEQQLTTGCISCHTNLRYAVIANVLPHIYCARCHNAYSEPSARAQAERVWWKRLANRQQHHIQSHAPVCECGGMFLFNAHPHCTHCGHALSLPFPEDPKGRLLYSNLVVFTGTKVYLDNGTITTYQFAL